MKNRLQYPLFPIICIITKMAARPIDWTISLTKRYCPKQKKLIDGCTLCFIHLPSTHTNRAHSSTKKVRIHV